MLESLTRSAFLRSLALVGSLGVSMGPALPAAADVPYCPNPDLVQVLGEFCRDKAGVIYDGEGNPLLGTLRLSNTEYCVDYQGDLYEKGSRISASALAADRLDYCLDETATAYETGNKVTDERLNSILFSTKGYHFSALAMFSAWRDRRAALRQEALLHACSEEFLVLRGYYTVEVPGTPYCMDGDGSVYNRRKGKNSGIDVSNRARRVARSAQGQRASLLALVLTQGTDYERNVFSRVDKKLSAPSSPRERGPPPPFLEPGYDASASPTTAEPSSPPPWQAPPSPEQSPSKKTSNDWAGYLLTGLGLVWLGYGIFAPDKCWQFGGDEFECPENIKSEQRNTRIFFIGGSVAVTSLGIYFLVD